MTEQQFTDEYEAPEADAAEQSLPVDESAQDAGLAGAAALRESEVPMEVDPADAAEQAVSVPVDEDEYR
jgi:predicted negative regulator of RcsB-dependent stress response